MKSEFQQRSGEVGRKYEEHVAGWLTKSGYKITGRKVRHISGIEIDIDAVDINGQRVAIECKGGDRDRPGLRRSDNIWKVLGQTLALNNWIRTQPAENHIRFLVVTSAQPADDEPMAEPLRVAEALGQLTIVVVANPSVDDSE